ncbi:DUF4747 family protein [Aminobacter sp. BE322]|uniref:DUF4747 family protein n=1 Tax=unclassified Aminobacter TaxID=2644704 RepID=UPI003D203E6B
MAERNKVIQYCMLNVAASPHPEGVYFGLFGRAASRQVVFFGSDIATISKPERVRDGFFRGRIVCWTPINKDEPAVLTDVLEEIDFDDLNINIPDNVGFNGRAFLYIFREADHTLFVEIENDHGKRLSPQRARRIFGLLFEDGDPDAPLVEVTVIPDEDALRRIFAIPKLKKLRIHIVRPNADDGDISRIMGRLVAQKAKAQDFELFAAPGPDGLELDQETKTEAEVAEHNGFVEGAGQEDDGTSVKLSTREYPRIIRRIVGQFGSTFDEAMAIAVETLARAPRD